MTAGAAAEALAARHVERADRAGARRRSTGSRPGDRVELRMPHGDFTYRVERTRIVEPTEISVIERVDHDRLVLSACHPLHSAARRIVMFARLKRP